MSPLASGVIGVCGEDLRNFFSGPQIDVSVGREPALGRLLIRLPALLALLFAALALGLTLVGLQAHRGRHAIDFAGGPDVDRAQRIHQLAIVAAQDASASASAACAAVSAAAARSPASSWALRMRSL